MAIDMRSFLAYNGIIVDEAELKHYGVKGMKWDETKEKKENPADKIKRLLKDPKFVSAYKKITADKTVRSKVRKERIQKLIDSYKDQ